MDTVKISENKQGWYSVGSARKTVCSYVVVAGNYIMIIISLLASIGIDFIKFN